MRATGRGSKSELRTTLVDDAGAVTPLAVRDVRRQYLTRRIRKG